MAGLKDRFLEVQVGGYEVTPDEIDMDMQYVILNPSTSATWFGTVAPGTVAGNFVIDNARADYPRNVVFSIVGPAGGVGGTTTVYGQDQFGRSQSEAIVVGSANGGGTTAGSLVFAVVGSATYSPNGVNNTGTPRLGYAVAAGTSSTYPLWGLPARLGGTADIKRVVWNDNGTVKVHPAAAAANTTRHAFLGTVVPAANASYVVTYQSTFDSSGLTKLSNL